MAKRKMPQMAAIEDVNIDNSEIAIAEEPAEVASSTPSFKSFEGKVVKCDRLNVRAAASFQSDIRGTVSHGDTLEVTGESGDFYAVTYKGILCYVAKEYIREN